MNNLFCAVMAGGSGTRFWPMSRHRRPKQLLSLLGEASLLRATVDRIAPLCPGDRTLVITGERLRSAVQVELPEVPAANIVAEPFPRNTAPCLGLAALVARQRDPDAILCLLPADHHVGDAAAFRAAIETAAAQAARGRIVTLGIMPTRPETGFGYIETASTLMDGTREVARFVEKPDLATAATYLAGGRHLWNGGIFVVRADVAWQAICDHLPAVATELGPLAADDAPAAGTGDFGRMLHGCMLECPSVSIDYGIMEHRRDLLCVPLQAGWSDVGTWAGLLEHRESGADNFLRGDVKARDCEGSVIVGEGIHVSAVGLRDIVVAATADAVLVLPAERSQEVRQVIDRLRTSGREELL